MYYYFGGFDKVTVQKVETDRSYILDLWGEEFNGNMQDTTWKNLFLEIRDRIVHGILNDPITIVYYRKPKDAGRKGNIEAFIGASLQPDSIPPRGLTEIKIVKKGVLRVTLNMHPVVMPSPSKVRRLITRYAAGNNLGLDTLMIEKYYHDNSIAVEVPVR